MPTDRSDVNILHLGIAEAIGTFILVFVGAGVATAAVLGRPIAGIPLSSLSVGLAFALTLAALVATLGHVSGAHVNPAVTLGLACAGRFPWRFVPAYIISQFVGAILAGLAIWATYGDAARSGAALGATYPTPTASDGQAFLIEVIITFILLFVIMAVATDERANTAVASIAIGFALGIGVLVGGPISGGAANPARAFGPMVAATKFTGVWIYLIAPFVGGIIASLFYKCCLSRTSPPPPEAETSVIGEER